MYQFYTYILLLFKISNYHYLDNTLAVFSFYINRYTTFINIIYLFMWPHKLLLK